MPPMSQEVLPGGYWLRPVLFDEFLPVARPGAGPHPLEPEFSHLAEDAPGPSQPRTVPPTLRAVAR